MAVVEQLRIEVQWPDEDIDSLLQEVDALREDLLQLDVEKVERPAGGPAPEGTRSGAAELMNVLLVALPPALPLLERLVAVVGEWLSRSSQSRSVVLKIGGNRLDLTGVDAKEQRRLTDAWLDACATVRQERQGGDSS